MDPELPKYPNERYDLICAECGAKMVLRESKFGPFYGCTSYPECKGSHGAHSDGKPKGKPGNAATKKARIEAHRLFDRIWKENLVRNRGAAYTWMQKALGLSKAEAHIGEFSIDQCEKLMRAVYQDFPKVRTDRWTLLLVDPLGD
jgi:ssDNA-binding Zn-finger/Zn-ribbon topoisomerase 1